MTVGKSSGQWSCSSVMNLGSHSQNVGLVLDRRRALRERFAIYLFLFLRHFLIGRINLPAYFLWVVFWLRLLLTKDKQNGSQGQVPFQEQVRSLTMRRLPRPQRTRFAFAVRPGFYHYFPIGVCGCFLERTFGLTPRS